MENENQGIESRADRRIEHNVGRSIIVSSALIAGAMIVAATVYAYAPGTLPANSQPASAAPVQQVQPVQNANNNNFPSTGGGCVVQ